ncbi:MAG TPA: TetR/AcrR family transcriptional regulator [Chitinophagales bacterium]|nr:TetR/AcrR family transcriptional regulator [Chitinophagales bacterium]
MEYQVSFKVNDNIYLRDPESSELGKEIIKNSIELICELGFEQFTFKKLAIYMCTTEASIYRYFENKHRLLLYILNWYWNYMTFLVHLNLQNLKDPSQKLKLIIHLLTKELPDKTGNSEYNMKFLYQIILVESSKVYLIKEVNEINKNNVYKAYKDLCARIADVIYEYNPKYPYAHSLSSSLIEMAHHQQYFVEHLPRLTNAPKKNNADYTTKFLEHLIFKTIQ